MHVSNFRKVKRVKDVIKVFNLVDKEYSAKLLMIGDGPERLKVERLARKLGVNKNVKFFGKLKVLKKYLQSQIYLFCLQKEKVLDW